MNNNIPLIKNQLALVLFFIGSAAVLLLLYQYITDAKKSPSPEREDRISISVKSLGISLNYSKDDFAIIDQAEIDNETQGLVLDSENLNVVFRQSNDLNIFYNDTPIRSDNVPQDFLSFERRDHSGFFGYKLQYINSELEKDSVKMIYRFHRGDNILEIVSTSNRIENMQILSNKMEELIANIKFDGARETQNVLTKHQALFSIGQSQREYFNSGDQRFESVEYQTDAIVTNNALAIDIPYDSHFVSVTNNYEEPIYGGPSLRFIGNNVSILVREEDPNFPYSFDKNLDVLRISNLMAITRFDHFGYVGQRRWNWFIQNEQKYSRIEYRINKNDKILVVDALIENTDPESADFIDIQSRIDALVNGMTMNNTSSQQYFMSFDELHIQIDSFSLNNN